MMGGSNTSNPRLNDKIKMDSVSHSSYNGLQTLFGKEYANLYKDEIRITDLFYVAKNSFSSFDNAKYFDECNIKFVRYTFQPTSSYEITRYGVSRMKIIRIYNAASRIKCNIIVIGSHANGTATLTSDWDYIIEGLNNKKWKKIKNSIPGAKDSDRPNRNIDIVRLPLDRSRPYIIISPSLLLNKLLGNV